MCRVNLLGYGRLVRHLLALAGLIAVSAAASGCVVSGASPEGARVDVIVAEQNGPGAKGRTYVAASGVKLLALAAPKGAGEEWRATLALTREQALELIGAEAGARQIRLLSRS